MIKYRVSADQSHMVVSLIDIRCYLDFSADELLALLIDRRLKFMFFSHVVLP